MSTLPAAVAYLTIVDAFVFLAVFVLYTNVLSITVTICVL